MTVRPNNWREEDRAPFAEAIADSYVKGMSEDQLIKFAWDLIYDNAISKEWPDLWEMAEEFAPEVVERSLSESLQEGPCQ